MNAQNIFTSLIFFLAYDMHNSFDSYQIAIC